MTNTEEDAAMALEDDGGTTMYGMPAEVGGRLMG